MANYEQPTMSGQLEWPSTSGQLEQPTTSGTANYEQPVHAANVWNTFFHTQIQSS